MIQAILLDRDGVLNRERSDYVKSWEEFDLLPHVLPALGRLASLNRPIVVITNDFRLDLPSCVFVGDSATGYQAAAAVGCQAIPVQSGRQGGQSCTEHAPRWRRQEGRSERIDSVLAGGGEPSGSWAPSTPLAPDLAAAVTMILGKGDEQGFHGDD
jgi:histidinol phosphatase-like enzyme